MIFSQHTHLETTLGAVTRSATSRPWPLSSALALAMLLFLGVGVRAQDPINEMCPVITDEVIDPAITVVYEGQVVGLCCRKCQRDFEKDPNAYTAALASLTVAQVAPVAKHDDGDEHDNHGGIAEHGAHAAADVSAPSADTSSTATATDEADGHDHIHEPSSQPKLLDLAGRLHPLVIHFPIALILVAALAELLLLLRPQRIGENIGRFCISLGAASAIVAAALGWLRAEHMSFPTIYTDTILYHRWTGVSVAALACVAAYLSHRSVRTEERTPYRVVLFVTALVVGAAGHLGASLVYGLDYFE